MNQHKRKEHILMVLLGFLARGLKIGEARAVTPGTFVDLKAKTEWQDLLERTCGGQRPGTAAANILRGTHLREIMTAEGAVQFELLKPRYGTYESGTPKHRVGVLVRRVAKVTQPIRSVKAAPSKSQSVVRLTDGWPDLAAIAKMANLRAAEIERATAKLRRSHIG
jgi:hypothetical protein